MDSSLVFNNKKYLSVKQASKLTGYSKDYISKLCREKIVDGKMLGKNWFVSEESVLKYKRSLGSRGFQKMEGRYISVKDASSLTGYSKDYISRLCRQNLVAGRLIGRVWFVDEEAVIEYKNTPTSFDFIKNLEKKYNLSKDVPVQKVVKDKPLSVSKKRKPELVSSFSQKIIVLFSILIFVLGLSYDGGLSFGNVSKTISSLPSNTYKTLDELTNFYG